MLDCLDHPGSSPRLKGLLCVMSTESLSSCVVSTCPTPNTHRTRVSREAEAMVCVCNIKGFAQMAYTAEAGQPNSSLSKLGWLRTPSLLSAQNWIPQQPQTGTGSLEDSWRVAGLQSTLESRHIGEDIFKITESYYI